MVCVTTVLLQCIMPSVERVCEWEEHFPKNGLFISQVKYTLQLLQVDVVVCEEEAELARQAAKTQNSYIAAWTQISASSRVQSTYR